MPPNKNKDTMKVCKIPCFKEELVTQIKTLLPDETEVRRIASLYGALSDPSRLRVLLALSHGELCVCDVSHVTGLSISATSHQLRILRNLNLVNYRTDGRMAYYSLTDDESVRTWLEQALPLNKDRSAGEKNDKAA